jgi:ubiquinone/menaquinone biosynthesis C-methylase UbiE
MVDDAKASVRSQFARQAAWYTVSAVHRHSAGLDALVRLAAPGPADRAVDVATGTGFTAFALAAHGARVLAVDMTPGMLEEARKLRESRGLGNVAFCLADAESLPVRSACADLVTCRHAAHHFPHLPAALSEMARVVRTGGRVVVDDTCAPEDRALAALMDDWERRRDPSHVTSYSPARLREMFERYGLGVTDVVMTHVPLRFSDWVRRAGMPAEQRASLRAGLLGASPAAQATFRIRLEDDGDVSFGWDEIVILGVKR